MQVEHDLADLLDRAADAVADALEVVRVVLARRAQPRDVVAEREQVLQRAVVQRLGDAAARAVARVERVGDEPRRAAACSASWSSRPRRSIAPPTIVATVSMNAIASSLSCSGSRRGRRGPRTARRGPDDGRGGAADAVARTSGGVASRVSRLQSRTITVPPTRSV